MLLRTKRALPTKIFPFCGFWVVLAIGLVGLISCGSKPGTVEGTVTWDSKGEAIPDARVVVFTLEKFESTGNMDVYQKGPPIETLLTDENGKYSIALEPGAYVLQVWLQGQAAADRMVDVKPGRRTTVDISLSPQSP